VTGGGVSTTSASRANPAKNLKHPNNTLGAMNLFLKHYYETHEPISTEEFKELWKNLPPEERKVWETRSRAARNAKKTTENRPA